MNNFYLSGLCSIVYGVLGLHILVQSPRLTNATLTLCCATTSGWAAYGALFPEVTLNGMPGFLDATRIVTWYAYLLHLYYQSKAAPTWQIRGFAILGSVVFCALLVDVVHSPERYSYSLLQLPIALRLGLSVAELLLIENLYLNLPKYARWHITLPCVLLGGLACIDVVNTAEAALFRRLSVPLSHARVVVMTGFAPILILAALRGHRWNRPVRLSQAAAFHSATLVLSGSVLITLAVAGELIRHFDDELGWVAELSLLFAGVVGLSLFFSSKSARSILERIVTRHFFADRYDYRTQWLQCIATLSGTADNERASLQVRAIRTVADIVNSPNGALFTLNKETNLMLWEESWNMPQATGSTLASSIVAQATHTTGVVDLSELSPNEVIGHGLSDFGSVWLVIPLTSAAGLTAAIIVGPPRVPFPLDQEVLDLLRIVGQEVTTSLAEKHAAETLAQTRHLHEYSKRFAFVAHDIKNVSSQLAMLLHNAESYLSIPEFQRDMLNTVKASVQKIDALLYRLDGKTERSNTNVIDPALELQSLLNVYARLKVLAITVEAKAQFLRINIDPDTFATLISHLLNNAIEACPAGPILIRMNRDGLNIVIDIVDHGTGMTPDFVKNDLFAPFRTDKRGGSGIGAFQARELIRENGGHLMVISELGRGTTMRILLPEPNRLISHLGVESPVNVVDHQNDR